MFECAGVRKIGLNSTDYYSTNQIDYVFISLFGPVGPPEG